ncbi:MAG: hypothetical protein ACK4NF_05910 [Planctomycetota bacterium]
MKYLLSFLLITLCPPFILITHLSCTYDAKKDLEKNITASSVKNPQYLKSYLQTIIDLMLAEIPDKNYHRLLKHAESIYLNTKYSSIKNKKKKKEILDKIREIKKMIIEHSYNRTLITKLEQLRKLISQL